MAYWYSILNNRNYLGKEEISCNNGKATVIKHFSHLRSLTAAVSSVNYSHHSNFGHTSEIDLEPRIRFSVRYGSACANVWIRITIHTSLWGIPVVRSDNSGWSTQGQVVDFLDGIRDKKAR